MKLGMKRVSRKEKEMNVLEMSMERNGWDFERL
jgi:hypothetical protein